MANNINTLVSGSGTVKSGAAVGGTTTEGKTLASLNKAASLASGASRRNESKMSAAKLNSAASLASGAKRKDAVLKTETDEQPAVAPNEDIFNEFMATVAPFVKMTDAEKDYFHKMSGQIAQNGGNAGEWAQDFLGTNAVANALGVSRTEASQNRSVMLDYYLGIEDQPLTFTTAASLVNSIQQGQRQQEVAKRQESLLNLYKEGYADASPEVQFAANSIVQMEAEMEYYQDSTPRSWLTEWAQDSLQQLPYMAEGTISGIVGSIIGGAAGAVTGVGIVQGAKTGGNLARFSTYSKQFEASAFWNMKKAGVSTETALKYSAIDGIVNGLNETFLDVGYGLLMGSLGKVIGVKDLAGRLIPSMLSQVSKNGTLASFLGRFLLYMGLDASGEFVQESTQSLTSSALLAAAKRADGLGWSALIDKDALKSAWEEGIQGFATGLFFGGFGGVVDIATDFKTSTKLKNNAIHSFSKESFVKNSQNRLMVQKLRLGGEELTEEQVTDSLSGLYDSTQSVREDLKNNIRKDIFEQLKTIDGTLDESVLNNMVITDREIKNEKGEVISGKGTAVKTKDDGSLYFVIDRETASDDGKSTTYTMRIANPDVIGSSQIGETYVDAKTAGMESDVIESLKSAPQSLAMEQVGKISFTVNDEDGTLTIDSVQIQSDSSSLKKEAVQELSDMYPEYNITWENQTESDKAVFSDIESGNPRNTSQKTYGLNYREKVTADDADTAYVKRWLGNKFSEDTSENNLMATILQSAAKARGLSGREFIEKYLNEIRDVQDSQYKDDPYVQRYKNDKNTKGFTVQRRDEITKQVKATIYAGLNADPTTFLHELHHVIMLMDENMKEFTGIYQKVKGTKQFKAFLQKNVDILFNSPTTREALAEEDKDGNFVRDEKGRCIVDENKLDSLFKSGDKWTEADFEIEARIYEAYIRSGQTFNPTLTGFFRRVAETFRQIYRSLRNGFASVKLNDEVVEYFDKLYGYDKQTGTTSKLSGSGELFTTSERITGGEKTDALKQEEEYDPEKYLKIRQNILDNYSDTSLYTKTDTPSERVYVYKDFYEQYLNDELNKDLRGKLEKNLRGAEALAQKGFTVYVLPENIIFSGEKYDGKIPDSIVNGHLTEFKELTSITYSQFKKQLKNGLAKSDIVYMRLSKNGTIDNKGIERNVLVSIKGQTVSTDKYNGKIIVTSLDGNELTAYEIKNGTPERVPLTRLGNLPQPSYNIASSSDSVKNILKQDQSPAEQYEAVKAQYYGTDKYMIAPDGKASNLTEDLWIWVRTPNFKKWAGDWENDPEHATKILDEHGEPMQVYHGTKQDLTVLDGSKDRGQGRFIYLSTDRDFSEQWAKYKPASQEWQDYVNDTFREARHTEINARYKELMQSLGRPLTYEEGDQIQKEYDTAHFGMAFSAYRDRLFDARVYALFVNSRNPFNPKTMDVERFLPALAEHTGKTVEELKKDSYTMMTFKRGYYPWWEMREVAQAVMDAGYDSIILAESDEGPSNTIAVRNSNQVKSATSNSGEFSLENDSFLKQEAEERASVLRVPTENDILMQYALHGSASDFDEFKSEFINSGSRSQAFGYGFYFTDSDVIAKKYADAAYTPEKKQRSLNYYSTQIEDTKKRIEDARKQMSVDEDRQEELKEERRKIIDIDVEDIKGSSPTPETLRKADEWKQRELRELENTTVYSVDIDRLQELLEYQKGVYQRTLLRETQQGHLYKVIIPDDGYLSWEDEVPQSTREKLVENETDSEIKKMLSTLQTGGEVYNYLSSLKHHEDKLYAVRKLQAVGIKGTQYKATSMGISDSDAVNYVVFAPEDVQIVENSILRQESDSEKNDGPKYKTVEEAEAALTEYREKNGVKIDEEAVRINASNVHELYRLAEDARGEFSEIINNLQKELGVPDNMAFSRTTLKGFDRVIEKAIEYKGDVGRVVDVNGSTFMVDTLDNARSTFERAVSILGDKVAKTKRCVTPAGYKDFKINIRTSNGFIGELIILDENTSWMKMNGIGHKIYEAIRKIDKYLDTEDNNDKKYQELFGMNLWTAIDSLVKSLNGWSRIAYENAEAIKNNQYDNAGFTASLYAVSLDITELSNQLRPNIAFSSAFGSSSYTLPSEDFLRTETTPDSLLNAVSQISKYIAAIEASSNLNVTQNGSEVKQNVLRQGNDSRATLQFKGKELQSYSLSEADVQRITNLINSVPIDISDDTTTKETAEETYRKIGTVTNAETGDKVQFVRASFGKIERHKDYAPRLIGRLGELFKDATFLFNETPDYSTPRADGTIHKMKSNVGSFSNYGTKITLDGMDYFIRYTVQNIKNRNNKITERQFHSQQLTSIKISNLPMTSPSFLGAGRSVASDYKLSSLLKTVNNLLTQKEEANKADLEALQAQSQRKLEEMAISGESLKQVGDDEWTETAKRIALEAPSLEDFFRLYRERIESGEVELSDSNTALLLSDIYDESKQENYEDFDESYYSDYEDEAEAADADDDFWKVEDEEPSESAASASDTSEEVPDWFDLDEPEEEQTQPQIQTTEETASATEETENTEEDEDDFWKVEDDDESSTATATSASSTEMPDDVPDWFDLDTAETTASETEQSIREMEDAVTEVQKVVVDSDLPKKLSLDHSRSLDTSHKARAVEFASILRESKEETIKFLETLKEVNAEFFYNEPRVEPELMTEEDYNAEEMRRSAYDEFGNISKFIQNLIYDSRGATVSRDLRKLSDRAWKIVAGQVARNAEVYMDLYARASGNTEWSGDNSIEAQVLAELGITEKEWNNLSYYKRQMYLQDIADKELREKIMSGRVYDADLRGWIRRAEAKAEASLAEAKAIEESLNYTVSENKKTILRLSTGAKDAQTKIADLQTEQEEVQDKIDRLVIRMENKLKRNGTPTGEETLLHSELKKRQNQLKRRQTQYENALKAWQNKNLKKADTNALAAELERTRQLFKDAQDKVTALLEKNDLTPEEALERLENLYSAWQDSRLKEKFDEIKEHYKDRLEQATKDKNDALKKQHEKLSGHYQERLKNATKDKNDALKKAHNAYMAAMRERESLRRIRAEKERLARQIMKAPSANVALEEARQIRAIQALIDPAYRRSTMKTIDGVQYSVEELRRILNNNPDDPILQSLTERQLERLTKKSLNEMTLSEIEETYQCILKLREDGLNKRRGEILQRKSENQIIYNSLMAVLRENPKFKEYGFEGTEDKKNRQNTKKNKIRNAWYQTLNMARKAQTLDNGEKGVFYDLLIRKKRLLQSEEMKNVMERSRKIESIIKENKLSDSLYKTWSLTLEDGRSVTFTTSELAYIYLSQNNEDNRDAIAYGTLISTEERANIIAAAEEAIIGEGKFLIEARNNKIDGDIRTLGDWRYDAALKLATEVIEKDKGMLALVKAIEADFNDPSFNRVVNLVRKLYNVEVKKQDYYLPINRTDFLGKEPGEDLKNDLLNQVPGTKGSVEKGFTKERLVIAPRNQKAVKYDLFKVWTNAVKNQEHFLAMQEYVNQLNSIFVTSNTKANTLRANIENTYGSEMLAAIDTHIKEIADPNAGAVQADPLKEILKAAKGNIYSAYLGFKLSSITNQLITSPAAFFGKVGPVRYAKNLLQMTLPSSFKKTSEEVFRLSPFMKSRNFDIIAGEIKDAAESVGMPKYKKAWANFLDFGLKGLEWVDQYTVVAGWKSIYEQELERLGEATEENIRKAVQIADEYVQETQPQSDKTEIAPLFKNKNEMVNILLQFQSSLNVVWNNLAYDTVNNFKRKNLRTAIGTVFGYAAAGALLSLAHGDFQPDDDDDDYSFWRRFYYSVVSQGVESIPVFSSYVDSIFGYVVNNEKPNYNTTTITPFPMAGEMLQAGKYTVQAIKERNAEYLGKAMEKGANAFLMGTGLPYSGIRELKAIEDRGLQALIGAR